MKLPSFSKKDRGRRDSALRYSAEYVHAHTEALHIPLPHKLRAEEEKKEKTRNFPSTYELICLHLGCSFPLFPISPWKKTLLEQYIQRRTCQPMLLFPRARFLRGASLSCSSGTLSSHTRTHTCAYTTLSLSLSLSPLFLRRHSIQDEGEKIA